MQGAIWGKVARKYTGHPVKLESKINNKYCFSINISHCLSEILI